MCVFIKHVILILNTRLKICYKCITILQNKHPVDMIKNKYKNVLQVKTQSILTIYIFLHE